MAGFLVMVLRDGDRIGKMKNPPADGRGVGASDNAQRLPYISRRRERAADIAHQSGLDPCKCQRGRPPGGDSANEEVDELPRVTAIEMIGIVGKCREQVVATGD